MPVGGSKPGERRGGRQKGTPNKAKVEREAKLAESRERILATLTPEQIAAMSPLDVMLQAMQIEAQTGEWRTAAALAKEAAPYLHAKKTEAPALTPEELMRFADLARSEAARRGYDDARATRPPEGSLPN